jgi:PAS domain S-box-containing protein
MIRNVFIDKTTGILMKTAGLLRNVLGGRKTVMLTQKQIVLIMRWLMVLLVIFMAAYSTKGINFGSPNYMLALVFLVVNLCVSSVPERFFTRTWFVYLLFLLDIAFVSSVIYFSEGIDTDFYLIYFLSIFMSSVGQRIGGAFPVAVISSLLYGWLVYKKYGNDMFSEPSFWLRMPFFFLIAIFSSFWAVQVAAERKKKEQAEEFNLRLKREIDQAIEELLKANEDLKYYKEYNENVLASISSGVIVVDLNGMVTTFNHQASEILKQPAKAVLGKKLSQLPGLELLSNLLERTMETGNNVRRDEMPVTIDQNRQITIGLSTSLLHSQTARTNGAIAIFHDLTATKSLEERVKRSEKLAVLGEMAAVMAHEVRNPLNAIAGFAQLLQNKVGEDDPRRKYIDIITNEAFRIDTLISDILDFAHQKNRTNAKMSVGELVDKVVSQKAGSASRKGVALNRTIAPDMPSLWGDAVRIERVLLNLVNNAIEATEPGGTICLGAGWSEDNEGPLIQITVSDSGCGIPPENLEAIFKPFFTTKSSGTGLGLAIIQKIVEEHGGTIDIKSEIGKGTIFAINLPAKQFEEPKNNGEATIHNNLKEVRS